MCAVFLNEDDGLNFLFSLLKEVIVNLSPWVLFYYLLFKSIVEIKNKIDLTDLGLEKFKYLV